MNRNFTLPIVLLFLASLALPVGAQETNSRPVISWPVISWSGHQWRISDSGDRTRGPGPNIFSGQKENVFVDPDGDLHLKITQRTDGRWSASEVALTQSLGFGTYEWEVASRYDGLPSNVVVGLFTYLSPQSVAEQTEGEVGNGKPDTPHEIDIEFTGAWGPGNHYFTTHDPDVKSPGLVSRSKPTSGKTTHRFTWSPDEIVWESFDGYVSEGASQPLTDQRPGENNGKPIRHVYTGPVIPSELTERVMINFWLFGGRDKQPSVDGPADGKPQELVIHGFKHTPLEPRL